MSAALPSVSLVGAALLLVPLPAQLKKGRRNIPHAAILGWLAIANVVHGVDAILWAGNADVKARVWGDIATNVLLSASFAVPAATVCASARLEALASARKLPIEGTRARGVAELSTCIVLPLLYSALHLLVQDHRFVIIEDFGCVPAVQSSVVGILVVYLPLVLLCLASTAYIGRALSHMLARRSTFALHLGARTTGTSVGAFIRLLSAFVAQTVLVAASVAFVMVERASGPLTAYTPPTLSGIVAFRTADLNVYEHARIALEWWLVPMLSLVALVALAPSTGVAHWLHARLSSKPPRPSLPVHLKSQSFESSTTVVSPATSRWSLDLEDTKHIALPMPIQAHHSPPRASPLRALSTSPTRARADSTASRTGLVRVQSRASSAGSPTRRARTASNASSPTRLMNAGSPTRPPRPTITINTEFARSTERLVSPVSSPEDEAADASFASSALSYVGSPTARQALGPAFEFALPAAPPGIHVPGAALARTQTLPHGRTDAGSQTKTQPQPLARTQTQPLSRTQTQPAPSPSSRPSPSRTASKHETLLLQVRKESDGGASFVSEVSALSILAPGNWPAPPTTVPTSPVRQLPPRSRSGTVGRTR